VYGPIITWTVCKVIEWLNGEASDSINDAIPDLLPMMRELVGVYQVKKDAAGLFKVPPKVSALRFGCIGCPAISKEKITKAKNADPRWAALARIWGIWQDLYLRKNRCCRIKDTAAIRSGPKPTWWSAHVGFGPLRMAARKHYFTELLDIQRQAGVELVTPDDEAFIRDCWERKVYPRGWSEADELTEPPTEANLFTEAVP
jgi:hypothetical protein